VGVHVRTAGLQDATRFDKIQNSRSQHRKESHVYFS
jgi:hypothetical protein